MTIIKDEEKIRKVQCKQYTGTLESLKTLIEDLKVPEGSYSYSARDNRVFIHHLGIIYRTGDHYIVEVDEE